MPIPMKKIDVSVPENAISVVVCGTTLDSQGMVFRFFAMPMIGASEFVEVKDVE